MIENIKEYSPRRIGKIVFIGWLPYLITDNLLLDSVDKYAKYESLFLTNHKEPYATMHETLSVYIRPLIHRETQSKTAKRIQRHMDADLAKSLYFFLSKKEQKQFKNIRLYILKQNRKMD